MNLRRTILTLCLLLIILPGTALAKEEPIIYTVKQGDVLGSIATAVYGSAKHWKRIYDANRDVIGDDPNKLKVGTKLRIPE